VHKKIAEIKQAIDFGGEDFEVFIISISTHQPDDIFSAQICGLLSVVNKISKDGALVSIESAFAK
jgi:UDP-N-acetyl-D-mannosaminuronic acid dehydrogenase